MSLLRKLFDSLNRPGQYEVVWTSPDWADLTAREVIDVANAEMRAEVERCERRVVWN